MINKQYIYHILWVSSNNHVHTVYVPTGLNTNKIAVSFIEKEKRDQLKKSHEDKLERDKQGREMQKQRQEQRKEKEKQRTQRQERRR